ncbi:UNVERIFIED_CONTAM: hypothetical protein MPE00_16845, partial [Xanthomonas citri pv. viticola]
MFTARPWGAVQCGPHPALRATFSRKWEKAGGLRTARPCGNPSAALSFSRQREKVRGAIGRGESVFTAGPWGAVQCGPHPVLRATFSRKREKAGGLRTARPCGNPSAALSFSRQR